MDKILPAFERRCSRGLPAPASGRLRGWLIVAAALGTACSGNGGDGSPEETGGTPGRMEAEGGGSDSGSPATYHRTVAFVDVSKDPTMFVPWDFENRVEQTGVRRILRGWLGRGGQWRLFVNEEWVTPPSRAPWRILPRGPARLVMGLDDILREVYIQEGIRDLSVQPGEVLAEWSGQRGDTYRLHAGVARLSGVEYQGLVVDAYTPRAGDSGQPSEWALLVGDGPFHLLIADLEGLDPYRAWARHGEEDIVWSTVTLTWGETRSFERARRDVPVQWRFRSEDGGLAGEFEPVSPGHLQTLRGEGPILPVLGVYEVAGQVTIGDTRLAVKGFLRHFQR